jgi:uracil-DNA glycosylase
VKPRWYHDTRTERVLSNRYPFGLARRFINHASLKNESKSLNGPVLFVASCADSLESGVLSSFSGPQGELLAKAISQGLKWSLDTTRLIFAFPKSDEQNFSSNAEMISKAQSALESNIKKLRPRVIVALGSHAAQALNVPQAKDKVDRWVRIADSEVLCTHDLRDVLNNADIKKAFWQDLKLLASKLN